MHVCMNETTEWVDYIRDRFILVTCFPLSLSLSLSLSRLVVSRSCAESLPEHPSSHWFCCAGETGAR